MVLSMAGEPATGNGPGEKGKRAKRRRAKASRLIEENIVPLFISVKDYHFLDLVVEGGGVRWGFFLSWMNKGGQLDGDGGKAFPFGTDWWITSAAWATVLSSGLPACKLVWLLGRELG